MCKVILKDTKMCKTHMVIKIRGHIPGGETSINNNNNNFRLQ